MLRCKQSSAFPLLLFGLLILVLAACSPQPAVTASPLLPEPKVTYIVEASPTPLAVTEPAVPLSSATPPQITLLPTETQLPATATPFTGTPTPSRVVERTFFSQISQKEQTLKVYLPPGYTADPQKPYPLLILLHGLGYDSTQWLRLGIPEAADALIQAGSIAPLVIVMPQEENTLLGYENSTFGRVVSDEILPWTREQYPVCTERICTAIGGISRGAAWAASLGFDQWDVFGEVGLHSVPGTLDYLPDLVMAIPPERKPRVYMDIGKDDVSYQKVMEFTEMLKEAFVVHTLNIQPGEHDEEYWSAHVSDYLRWYSEGWQHLYR